MRKGGTDGPTTDGQKGPGHGLDRRDRLRYCLALGPGGASVVVNGRSQQRVEEAVQRIQRQKKDAKVTGVAADLRTKDGVDLLTKTVPTVDIVVNNLGIFEAKPFPEITDEDWLRFFEGN